MNIVLAVGLLTGLFMVRYPKLANADDPATIGYVHAGLSRRSGGTSRRRHDRSDRQTFAIRNGRTCC